ncbi:hypothetical protein HN51_068565 [Arachis hypogaea]|uniref:uncharacterized protein isoform X2 n=1 Tax=Arachis hypogaea TaxID=3818 RepID=UPI000DECFB31|nr:uncharacterized protein LOC112748947 isoform X1 [Arachis hypogaea]
MPNFLLDRISYLLLEPAQPGINSHRRRQPKVALIPRLLLRCIDTPISRKQINECPPCCGNSKPFRKIRKSFEDNYDVFLSVPVVYRLEQGQPNQQASHRMDPLLRCILLAPDARPPVPGKRWNGSLTDEAPPKGNDDPLVSAASCGSTYTAPPHECTPIARSVVSSVSGMQTDIRRLSDALARHDAVVLELRDAIRLLTGERSPGLNGELLAGLCRFCNCNQKNTYFNLPKENRSKKKASKTCRRAEHTRRPVPEVGPVIDTTFSMDHFPFTTNRSKKQTRKPIKSWKEPRSKRVPEVVDLSSDDGVAKTKGHTTIKTVINATGRSGQDKFHGHAADSAAVVNLSGLLSMQVDNIPKSMNLVFRPTVDMNLSGVELAVAAYIFNRDLPESEVLIDIGDCFASRGALMTLAPKEEVVDDVLNVVIRMLTNGSQRSCWFLPTVVMQVALGGRSLTSANMTSIRNNYMRSKVDQTTKVYQPMWCDQHWYLMIIDIPQMNLVYLDSLRDPREADARKTAMVRVALYLEGLTLGKSWLSGPEALRPRFSAFEFEEPEVPQQAGDSMDCGVWVAQWMIREHLWQDHGNVNNATRMRLAVDLVMKSHNDLGEDAVSKAVRHWQQKAA